jgi:L-threonylcarbamoyladenylate synthase
VGVESAILSLVGETPMLLRAGGITREALEAVVGPIVLAPSGGKGGKPMAPGQLPGHYAPRTPLRILAGETLPPPIPPPEGKRQGYLAFRSAPAAPRAWDAMEILSPSGDLREAAANLFACLHRLDAAGLDLILAEGVPETGLGMAILDRLRKAAAGSGPGPEGHPSPT